MDKFDIYYQPVFDLKKGVISGMEAHTMLNHSEISVITPEKPVLF